MNPKEKSLRLFFAALTLSGSLAGCRPISSSSSSQTKETPNATATYTPSPSATPEKLTTPTSPPTASSILPKHPTPEITTTPKIPLSFYEINGVRFDDPSLPTHLSLTLPDGTSIEIDAVFKTDKTGKNLANICTTGTGSICTFSQDKRLYLTPHAGYSEDNPLEAEFIRRFVEGGIMFQNNEDEIQQQLLALRGQEFSITNNGHTIKGPVLFAYRVAGNDLPEFLGDFIGGPDWIAARDPSLAPFVDQSGIVYVQLCGHRRRHEREIAGLEDNIYSRIILAIDFTDHGRAAFASLSPDQTPQTSTLPKPFSIPKRTSLSRAETNHYSTIKYDVAPVLRRGRNRF